ncbi:uncharacterized protein [Heliangelus exortis]|uniref:uncharacterized protein n=1 Tax=Heliangelus exortis TaxID=472823 RepID=UPI003A8D8ABB
MQGLVPDTIVTGVSVWVTVGIYKEHEPWGAHSHQSTSVKQYLPCGTSAVQGTKMSMEKEVHSQAMTRLTILQKRLQSDRLASSLAQPHSGVGPEEAACQPALPPLSRLSHAVRPSGAADTCHKLRPPAAPSADSARDRDTASGAVASSHRQLVRSAPGIHGDRCTATRAENWKPALHSPTAQPTPDPQGCGGTGAAGRVTVPAALGRDAGPGLQGPVVEQHQLRPAVRVNGCTDLRSLWVHHEAGANDLEILKLKMELLEAKERSWPTQLTKAPQQQQNDSLEKSHRQLKEGQEQHVSLTCLNKLPERPVRVCQEKLEVVHTENMEDMMEKLETHVPSQQQAEAPGGIVQTVMEDKPEALTQEEKGEDLGDNELCQGGGTITWESPWETELCQDPYTVTQEGPSWSSSTSTEATDEEACDLQEVSSVSGVVTDIEPEASALSGAPEEEEHYAPLGNAQQEEAKAPASPDVTEHKAVEEASKPPTHSPTEDDPEALLDAGQVLVSEVLCQVIAELQGASQQPQEQVDLAKSREEAAEASPPATPQDTELALVAEPQEEASTVALAPAEHEDGPNIAACMSADSQEQASTATGSLELHEDEVASPSPQTPPSHPSAPLIAPDDEGDVEAPPWPEDQGHQVSSDTIGDLQSSPSLQDQSEDDPGITPLPHTPALLRKPSRFRRVLRALRRAF